VAGVASGVAGYFRVSVWVVRAILLLSCAWKFSGGVAYGLLWLFLAVSPDERSGKGKRGAAAWGAVGLWVLSAAALVGVAFIVRWYDTSVIGTYALEIAVATIGVGLVWRMRDVRGAWWLRLIGVISGVMLAWVSIAMVTASEVSSRVWSADLAVNAIVVSALLMGATLVMCVVCGAAWVVHPERAEEREAALVAATKADMAAHLHDSVLQTLAVIQKQADDTAVVARLARAQEKELRTYLYGEALDEESFKAAMREVADELEATYPIRVELVSVGDHELTPALEALVAAAREASVNAAKHSGAEQVDVYTEVSGSSAQVFVRDRGKGFSPEEIGEDRMGIRRSIIGRMNRHGGRASIRSTPDEGTEIELTMPYGKDAGDE
jgi:signal transduction histidine kinase/phage shock protein PspC (stress-responsive transcriptional regulator)